MMAIDPICKMDVDEETAKWTSDHKDKTYYFCAPGCKAAFEENPDFHLMSDHPVHSCGCCGH